MVRNSKRNWKLRKCPEQERRTHPAFFRVNAELCKEDNEQYRATRTAQPGACKMRHVAKSVSLASRRKNHHRSGRKREVQLHNLAQGRFKSKHRCDPGFADVKGMALQ